MEKKWELLGKKHGLGMGKEGIVEMGLGFKKWVLEGSRVKSRRCEDLEMKRESIVET